MAAVRLAVRGQQLERRDMAGTHHAKVASIERREPALSQALDDREHRGVDEAHAQIAILGSDGQDALVVLAVELLDADASLEGVPQDLVERVRKALYAAPVVQLADHGSGYDPILSHSKELCALAVVSVRAIERSEKHARIYDERHAA
jgi:hypothetical protein